MTRLLFKKMVVNGGRLALVAGLFALASFSPEFCYSEEQIYDLNFSSLKSDGEKWKPETASDIQEYLNTIMDCDFISSIPFCNNTFSNVNGLGANGSYNSTDGALYIYSGDTTVPDELGGITFSISPEYWTKTDRINFKVYKYPSNIGSGALPSAVEIAVNGNEYKRYEMTQGTKAFELVTVQTQNAVVKDFSIRIPNVNKEENPYNTMDHYMALAWIKMIYNPSSPSAISTWSFATPTKTAYLSDETVDMPSLNVVPAAAAEYAVYSSSNPEVADFEDGVLKLKQEGVTTISAEMKSKNLYSPASDSFELTVTKNTSTVVGEIVNQESDCIEIYDLQGRKLNGNPEKGLYIVKRHGKTTKTWIDK